MTSIGFVRFLNMRNYKQKTGRTISEVNGKSFPAAGLARCVFVFAKLPFFQSQTILPFIA